MADINEEHHSHKPRPLFDLLTKRYVCAECPTPVEYKYDGHAGWFEHV